MLLSLFKAIKNLWFKGLDLFNQSGYMRLICEEGILALFFNLVDIFGWTKGAWTEGVVVAVFFCSPF
jgi:hypothetical protein